MRDLIDRQALYEQTAEWQAEALRMVQKFIPSADPDDVKEWMKWSIILNERTAFLYDITDAPAVESDGMEVRMPTHIERRDI